MKGLDEGCCSSSRRANVLGTYLSEGEHFVLVQDGAQARHGQRLRRRGGGGGVRGPGLISEYVEK